MSTQTEHKFELIKPRKAKTKKASRDDDIFDMVSLPEPESLRESETKLVFRAFETLLDEKSEKYGYSWRAIVSAKKEFNKLFYNVRY